jgi:acyl-CoA thioester hydrolase
MLSDFPAPFAKYQGVVQADWIDTNGHMNLAYFSLMFDRGTAALFEALNVEHAYQVSERCGLFAAECCILYERELLVGENVMRDRNSRPAAAPARGRLPPPHLAYPDKRER